MRRSDYEDQDAIEIIFDEGMMQSWDVFSSMQTQWRSSGMGAYGLDYNVLPMMFRIYKIDDEEAALNDIRILELRAIEIMRKQQQRS